MPGAPLSVDTLQKADIENAIWATEAGIDFIGFSFVRTAGDVIDLRKILCRAAREKLGDARWNEIPKEEQGNYYPNIIVKIEKPEVLDHLDEIVTLSDGVMIARGDLGVETDIARIAMVQKQIIETCRRLVRPVIVATQMLESMTGETIPTRAEATDVANAILDGADACMLSGETAIGRYPVQAVKMMNRIAEETEKTFVKRMSGPDGRTSAQGSEKAPLPPAVQVSLAVCDVAGRLADMISAAMILVSTRTGRTARNLSNQRNFVMTVGTTSCEAVLRRMSLYWGVLPIGNTPADPMAMLINIVERARKAGYIKNGERVVLISGIGTLQNNQNAIYVHQTEP